MNWWRFAGIGIGSPVALWVCFLLWSSDHAPKWALASSGLLAVAALAGCTVIGAVLFFWVTDDLRPSLRFRKPVVPLALAHEESALIGRRRFRNHPIKFWGGLTLNNSLFVGFILFDKPEYINLRDDSDSGSDPTGGNAGTAVEAESSQNGGANSHASP